MEPHQNLEYLYIKVQFRKHIKILRSDGVGKYITKLLINICMEKT